MLNLSSFECICPQQQQRRQPQKKKEPELPLPLVTTTTTICPHNDESKLATTTNKSQTRI